MIVIGLRRRRSALGPGANWSTTCRTWRRGRRERLQTRKVDGSGFIAMATHHATAQDPSDAAPHATPSRPLAGELGQREPMSKAASRRSASNFSPLAAGAMKWPSTEG
jgi:hypothetical protein